MTLKTSRITCWGSISDRLAPVVAVKSSRSFVRGLLLAVGSVPDAELAQALRERLDILVRDVDEEPVAEIIFFRQAAA